MNLDLDFNICQIDCDNFLFRDETCFHKYVNPYYCVDGYNTPKGVDVNNLSKTLFTWVMPNGDIYTDIDLEYLVGTKSRATITLNSGTNGNVTISIGLVNIAIVNFNTTLSQTIDDIVTIINSNSENTRWQSFRPDPLLDEIIIESMDYGVVNNNKQVILTINSGDMVFTVSNNNLTSGANGFTNEFVFQMKDILNLSSFSGGIPSGVHRVTYKVFDNLEIEVKRITKYFFIDFLEKEKLKAWILKDNDDGNCGCSNKFDERILELRVLLEKANIQFDCGDYKCAQKSIIKFNKLIDGICLDC